MSKPMFSIIVPIYKVEKYLEQCIKSILNQDFSDFELILVDDGSPDGCPEIADRYAEKDSRITVIHKRNEGLTLARISGLEIAKGNYIASVDGDDYMLPGALKCLYNHIAKTDADVYLFGFVMGESGKETAEIPDIPHGLYNDAEKKRVLFEKIIYDKKKPFFKFGVYPSVWSRIVKRELFFDVYFKIDRHLDIGEDFAATLPIMLKAESICFVPEPLYYYRIIQSSASHKFNINEMKFFASMLKGFEKSGVNMDRFGIKSQLGAYTVYVLFNYLYDLALNEENCGKYICAIKSMDKIIFEYIKECRYNFGDMRAVIMITLIKCRMWRIIWLYAKGKEKGGR